MVSVVVNLDRVMAERGIKDGTLAEQCAVHPTMIQKIRTHARLPSLLTLAKMAVALEVPLERLVTIKVEDRELSLSA